MGEQQCQENDQTKWRNPQPGGDPSHNLSARQYGWHGTGLRQQRHDSVLGDKEAHPCDHTYGAEDPAYRILRREAGGDYGPYRLKAKRHYGVFEPLVENGG